MYTYVYVDMLMYLIDLFFCLPVVPHKAVAEV